MILVTGSAGYIGSHVIKKLHLNNVKFLGIDNLSYSKKENIYNKQKFIKTDIVCNQQFLFHSINSCSCFSSS